MHLEQSIRFCSSKIPDKDSDADPDGENNTFVVENQPWASKCEFYIPTEIYMHLYFFKLRILIFYN